MVDSHEWNRPSQGALILQEIRQVLRSIHDPGSRSLTPQEKADRAAEDREREIPTCHQGRLGGGLVSLGDVEFAISLPSNSKDGLQDSQAVEPGVRNREEEGREVKSPKLGWEELILSPNFCFDLQ